MTPSFDKNVKYLQRQFQDGLPQKAHQLEDLWRHLRYLNWSENGFKTFQQMVHRLVGSGASFGLPDVTQTAQLLDQYLLDYQELGQPIGGIEFEMIDQMVSALVRTLGIKNPTNTFNTTITPKKIGEGKIIFLVEQDHVLSALMTVYLREADFNVQHFDSASACIQQLNVHSPHAVIIDPAITGDGHSSFAAISQIKSRVMQNVPIIFLSARSDMYTRLRALRAGCASYMTKPIDFLVLLNTLTHAIKTNEITHKVMIVDDEPLVANYHAEILRHAGMEVICVSQPMESLQRAAEFSPDLVVLDMHMPIINGIELATLLRQDEKFLLLPIIFVTSDTSIRLRQAIESLGVNGMLTKPVDMDALVNTCERAITDTFSLKHRIESITQRAQRNNQITRSYFFAAIDTELHNKHSNDKPSALYYLGLDIQENLFKELGPAGIAILHEKFCQGLAQIIGTDEQWSDLSNFVVCVLVGKRTREQHQQRVWQITEHMSNLVYSISDNVFVLNTYAGVHLLDSETSTANSALAQAEHAYESAKKSNSSGNYAKSYAETDVAKHTEKIKNEINFAFGDQLPEENLRICYQPMISLESSQVEHFEALVRWRINDDELIPASKFLQYIEHSNMRITLDRWVLQSAITAIITDSYARENASLFIHLADETLAQKSFFSFVANVLRSSRLRGQRRLIFIFEEPWVAEHPDDALALISALYNIQCGTCLSHAGSTNKAEQIIQQLTFDYIRLAPSLAFDLCDSDKELSLINIINTAKKSGAQIIATQVEDPKNLSMLWLHGVRLFQGYLLQSPDQSLRSHNDLDILKQFFTNDIT